MRTSEAINATTRTLLVEVDLDNPGGNLFSGSYAEVHLKIPAQNSTYLASGQRSDLSIREVAGWCGEKRKSYGH